MSQTKAQLIDPVDGSLVNADISASAAIDGSKISPTFTSTVNVTNTLPEIFLTDTNTSNARGRLNANGGGLLLGADNDNAAADSVISFAVDGSEKARIDENGRMMFGTTTAAAILTLDNTGQTSQSLIQTEDVGGSGAHAHIVLKNTTGTVGTINTVSDNLEFRVDDNTVFSNISGTENVRITSNGILRIGCTAQPSTTVSGAQFDAGGKTLRISEGGGTSSTTGSSIQIIGGGGATSIGAAAAMGAILNLTNSNNTDNNQTSIDFCASSGLSTSKVIGKNDSHSSRNGSLIFATSNGAAPAERARITNGGFLYVNKAASSDFGRFEVKGGTADDIETSDIRTETVATFSGSTPGTTASGKGVGIVIKPIADRGCNYFIGAANSSSNQEAHGSLIFRSGNFASATAERLRIDQNGHLLPGADNSLNLGSASKRWANLYTTDLKLSNEGSQNDVDSTWGNYTIQEGHQDLFLLNHRTGKKFKFNLTEVA